METGGIAVGGGEASGEKLNQRSTGSKRGLGYLTELYKENQLRNSYTSVVSSKS